MTISKSLKTKKIKFTGRELVVQDNKLIESPRFFTLQEQRLFLILLSKINPKAKEWESVTLRLTTKEFALITGADADSAIRDMKIVTEKFMSRVEKIKNMDERSTTYLHMVSRAKYWEGKGYADFEIAPEMATYLIGLRNSFTSYRLNAVVRLSSIYAIRIYEIMKRYEGIKSKYFELDELRKILAIEDGQHKLFSDLRLDVLEIAQREINAKTDIKIDYEYEKDSRKYVGVTISVKSQKIPSNDADAEIRAMLNLTPEEKSQQKKFNEIKKRKLEGQDANESFYSLFSCGK